MNFKMKVWFASLASILFIICVLITVVDLTALQPRFYENEFKLLNTAEKLNMNEEDVQHSIEALLDYTKGERDSLVIYFPVNEEMREIYTKDEILHMDDVKTLYTNAILVRNACLVSLLILLILLWVDEKKEFLEVCTYSFINVFVGFLFALIGLIIYASADFTAFWNQFHHIFFTNDLWLLDPRTSLMIQMLEEKVFFDLVILIIIIFTSIMLTIFGGSLLYKKRLSKMISLEKK